MQSGLTSLAIIGSISGSGLAMAKIIGSLFIVLTISGVSAPFTDKPKKMSEPFTASARFLSLVSTACADFHWLTFPSRPT